MLLSDPFNWLQLGIGASIIAFLPGGLVLLLVIGERLMQPADDLGCGFEHRPQLGFFDAFDVLAQMTAHFLETFAHPPTTRTGNGAGRLKAC